jgi:hypothetical protein
VRARLKVMVRFRVMVRVRVRIIVRNDLSNGTACAGT